MSNNRKIQVDIDRLLKKTTEGLEAYEELYEKFESASNPGTKERLEGDLKKEIKKLQRQREQIKGYIASSEVKDTRQLESFRKKIESKMEAFKQCEREMKTKAFSKEGLASAANDWNESPVIVTGSWLRSCIEEGRKKIEILEYEVHKSSTTKLGRRTKASSGKSDAQVRLELLQLHFHKWEALLRMVVNEEVDPQEVSLHRDAIEHMLEEDTEVAVLSDMMLYSEFDIPDPKPRPTTVVEDSDAEEKRTALSAKAAVKKTPSTTTPAAKSAVATVTAPATKTTLKTPAPAPMMSPSVDKTTSPSVDDDSGAPEWVEDDELDAANDDTFGDDTMCDAQVGSLAEMAQVTSRLMPNNDWESRKLELRQSKPTSVLPATTAATTGTALEDDELDAANNETFGDDAMCDAQAGSHPEMTQATSRVMPNNDWESRKLELRKAPSPSTTSASGVAPVPNSAAVVAKAPAPAPPTRAPSVSSTAPSSTPPLAAATVIQQQKQSASSATAPRLPADAAPGCKYSSTTTLNMLDMSLANMPHTLDVERNRTYEPPNAIDPIPYFPQDVHPVLSCREIYKQFDLETLFFIFYYHQKSFQQYFASKELKTHSFRYHTELRRWYQRREKPKESTQTSERGSYVYFDYENTWQRQTEDDFTFEYKYLEDELS